MPSINDRIGSQNVIRVLSNASAPPTRLVNLTDVNSTLKDQDGMILVWDLPTETFIMTSVIDRSLEIVGIATFSDTTESTLPTNGALIVSGGVGIGKNLNIGGAVTVAGIATFSSRVDINAVLEVLNETTIESNLAVTGITTLASSGGITTTGGELYVSSDLRVGNNLLVDGRSEFIGVATFRGGTINLGDSTSDDINVSGEFISNLVPNDDATYDIGIATQRWRDARFSGLVTTTDLYVAGVSTFAGDLNLTGDLDITGDVSVTGFVSVTEGLYYDADDYDGPNGVAYFDNTGKLIGAASTENALTESYFVLTTNSVGIPTWTSTIDGGSF